MADKTIPSIQNLRGKIGIGTASPAQLLDIHTASGDTGIRLYTTPNTRPAAELLVDSATNGNADFRLYHGTTINTRITSNAGNHTYFNAGNVGIGTTSPTTLLQATGGDITILGVNGESRYFGFTSSASTNTYVAKIESDHTANWGGNLKFFTGPSGGGNAERMRIAGDGNVGIGETAPSIRLYVKDSESIVGYFKSTTNKASIAVHDNDTLGYFSAESDRVSMGFNSGLHADNINIYKSGSNYHVGIGTVSPTTNLDVYNSAGWGGLDLDGTSGGELRLQKAGTTYLDIYASDNGSTGSIIKATDHLHLSSGNGTTAATTLFLKNDGNVGVGTLSPSHKLHVAGDARIEGDLTVNGDFTIVDTNTSTTEQFSITNDGTGPALIVNQLGAHPIVDFKDDSSSVFYIANGGLVGIGTASPDTLLHLEGSEPTLRIFDSANTLNQESTIQFGTEPGNRTQAEISSINLNAGNAAGGLIFRTNEGSSLEERMRIDNNGRVGIGNTAPASILALQGDGGNNKQLRLCSGSSSVYWDIGRNFNTGHFEITEDSGDTYFLIDKDNGSVGIGTASPTYKLDVTGTGRFTDQLKIPLTPSATTDAASKGYVDTTRAEEVRFTRDGINNSSYTMLCTVVGDRLASIINMTITGTSNSVVVGSSFEIIVNHYQDIIVRSTSSDYTEATIRITSNNDEDYSIELKHNGSTTTQVEVCIFPQAGETITPTTTDPNYTGAEYEHTATEGWRYGGEDNNVESSNVIIDGKVGVGVTAPTRNLIVAGTTATNGIGVGTPTSQNGLELTTNGTNYEGFVLGHSYLVFGTNHLNVGTAASERMRITSGGDVGIGTNTPQGAKLSITDGATPYSTGNNLLQIKRNATNGNDDTSRAAILMGNNSNAFTFAYGGTTDRLRVLDGGNNERFTVLNGGNVGISQIAPTAPLHVKGQVRVERSDATVYGTIDTNGNYRFGAPSGYHFTFHNVHPDAGGEIVRIKSTGEVGIGTNDPQADLSVTGGDGLINIGSGIFSNYNAISLNGTTSSGDYNFLSSATDKNLYINRTTNKNIFFRCNNANQMLLSSGGYLGIGTTSPQGRLDADGKIRSSHDIVSNSNYTAFSIGSDRTIDDYGGVNKDYWKVVLRTNGSGTTGERSAHAYGDLVWSGVDGVDTTFHERLVMRANGNVGIGVSVPAEKLEVAGNIELRNATYPTQIQLYETWSSSSNYEKAFLKFASDYFVVGASSAGSGSASGLKLQTDGSDRLTILSGGNVGIGTTSPSAELQVHDGGIYAGNGATKGYGFHDFGTGWGYKGATSPSRLAIFTDSAERITISSGGKVGIGNTSPATRLDVNGGVNGTHLTLSGTAGRGLTIGSTNGSGQNDAEVIYNAADTESSAYHSKHIFQLGGSEKFKIYNDSGQGKVRFTANIFAYTAHDQIAYFYSTHTTGYIRVRDSNDSTYLVSDNTLGSFGGNASAHANNLNINLTSGNVGIGNILPAYKLDVTGAIRATEQFRTEGYSSSRANLTKSFTVGNISAATTYALGTLTFGTVYTHGFRVTVLSYGGYKVFEYFGYQAQLNRKVWGSNNQHQSRFEDIDVVVQETVSGNDEITAVTIGIKNTGSSDTDYVFSAQVECLSYGDHSWADVSSTTSITDNAVNTATIQPRQYFHGLTVGKDDTGHDVKFHGATAGSYMLWDESINRLRLTDSTPMTFGDGDDLRIEHDGNYSYITEQGQNDLYIQPNSASLYVRDGVSGMVMLACKSGSGKVTELYGNNVKRLATDSGGVGMFGTLTVGANTDGHDVKFFGATSGKYLLWDESGDRLVLADNTYLALGTGSDALFYHTGSHLNLQNYVGEFQFINNTADGNINFKADDGTGSATTEYFRVDGGASNVTFSKPVYMATGQQIIQHTTATYLTHDGSNYYIINGTGDTTIQNDTADGDIKFKADNGSGGTTEYFRLDGGLGYLFVSKTLNFADNVPATFGPAGDLNIRHDGTDSSITNNTGDLYIKSSEADSDIIFQADDGTGGGNVETYFYLDGSYNNVSGDAPKTIFPDGSILALGTHADLRLSHDGVNGLIFYGGPNNLQISGNSVILIGYNDGSAYGETAMTMTKNGAVTIRHDNSTKFSTTSDGISITGGIDLTGELNFLGGGNKILDVETLAGSNTFKIRHYNPSGNLFEDAAIFTANAGAELHYNHSKKFETTSTGAKVTGNLEVDGITKQKVYTISSLPTAGSSTTGARAFVSDSAVQYNSSNLGAQAAYGGGSYFTPVYSDGSYWYIG